MQLKNIELWLALIVIAIITAAYLGVVLYFDIPSASGFFGHSLGIVGFILMLLTEILYSLRKRYMFARWGKLQHWLSFHIFTGLVGPYLVLLHSSWKFNGLAGILMLLTLIIVISGFIGRYFYTGIPRSADGTIMEAEQISQLIERNQRELARLGASHPNLIGKLEDLFTDISNPGSKYRNPIAIQRMWRDLEKGAPEQNRPIVKNLRLLWDKQVNLKRQLDSLAGKRRLLAIWHTVHIPLGVVLFTIAFIHIGAALYYATFLH